MPDVALASNVYLHDVYVVVLHLAARLVSLQSVATFAHTSLISACFHPPLNNTTHTLINFDCLHIPASRTKHLSSTTMSSKGGDNPPNEPVEELPVESRVAISVKGQTGNEIQFRVKTSMPFSRLFDAYKQSVGRQQDSLRFFFEGVRIIPTETPESVST